MKTFVRIFLRAASIALAIASADSAMGFTPITEAIDVNFHDMRIGRSSDAENLVQIPCHELDTRQVDDARMTADRQQLLQQRSAAIQQNDRVLINELNERLTMVMREQAVNQMVMNTLASVPVFAKFSLAPKSDLVLFLLSQSAIEEHDKWPRWPAGRIIYKNYSSNIPTHIEWRNVVWDHEKEYFLGETPAEFHRMASIEKFDAPKSDVNWHDSIDPFAFTYSYARGTETFADVPSPIYLEPDTSVDNCEASDCRFLRFGSGSFDLNTGQICGAWNSSRGGLFTLIAEYQFQPVNLRISYTVGFGASERKQSSKLELEAVAEAIDTLLKDFISDIIGPAQLFLVSDEQLGLVLSGGSQSGEVGEVREKLTAFRNTLVSELGHEPTIAEVEALFSANNVGRYRGVGNGKIAFVIKAGAKEAKLLFSRLPEGIRLVGVDLGGENNK